jgi:hypothetical protein
MKNLITNQNPACRKFQSPFDLVANFCKGPKIMLSQDLAQSIFSIALNPRDSLVKLEELSQNGDDSVSKKKIKKRRNRKKTKKVLIDLPKTVVEEMKRKIFLKKKFGAQKKLISYKKTIFHLNDKFTEELKNKMIMLVKRKEKSDKRTQLLDEYLKMNYVQRSQIVSGETLKILSLKTEGRQLLLKIERTFELLEIELMKK